MHIIDLTPLEVGVYNDHEADHITAPPDGWAMIPDDIALPSTFPRLGSLKAEEVTYTYEVEVEKDEIKTRDVEIIGENGKPVIVQEEYTEKVMVTEQCEKVIMTVTKMTEGTLPEPVKPEPTEMEMLQDEVTALQLALCDQYEENLALQEEVTNTQLALVELYEGGIA
jgi:hypothetical protein